MTDTQAISETCADIPYVTGQEIAFLTSTGIRLAENELLAQFAGKLTPNSTSLF